MMKRLTAIATATMLALAMSVCAVTAQETTSSKDGQEGSSALIAVGADPAPFDLKDLTGKQVVMQDELGKNAMMLVFWSLFCGPCQEELPLIDEMGQKYGDKGLSVYAINLDGPRRAKAVTKYMQSQGFSFSVLWEEFEGSSYVTADKYGVGGTPTMVLIDKKGKVSFTHVGHTSRSEVVKAVEQAIAN